MQLMYKNLARALWMNMFTVQSCYLENFIHICISPNFQMKTMIFRQRFFTFSRKLNLKVVFSVTVQELKKLCLEEYVCKQHLFERFS